MRSAGSLPVAAAEWATVYAIRRGRGFEQADELIGKDYAGVLVRDGSL
jgi:hypothetical protein